ncbi:MAG TPA: hypothetical protein VFX60_13630 [Micromonospora sp.]|nr:hypothetical protein [Micromonospora sp.]
MVKNRSSTASEAGRNTAQRADKTQERTDNRRNLDRALAERAVAERAADAVENQRIAAEQAATPPYRADNTG